VESSLVSHPAQWRWGGHRELLGAAARNVVDTDELWHLIASGAADPAQTYTSMFSEGMAVEPPPVRGEGDAGPQQAPAPSGRSERRASGMPLPAWHCGARRECRDQQCLQREALAPP
jgi:hypothetical protein